MGKDGFILVLILASNLCNASAGFHIRKLIPAADKPNSSSSNSQISAIAGSVDNPNTNPLHPGKPEEEKHKQSNKGNHNDTKPLPLDPNNTSEKSGERNPSAGKNDVHKADTGDAQATNPNQGDNENCDRSLATCRVQGMLACVKASKNDSKKLTLVVQNEAEGTLKVDVNLPDAKGPLLHFEVPKHKAMSKGIPTVGKHTKLTLNSGNAKCVLGLVNPVSTDFIQQLSFYSKQVSPIHAAFASFLLMLLFGGTWACCKLRKKNRDGIPYQELEMGLPEAASTANVDVAEGWDHAWDDEDDWDEETAVKSPGGHQIRNVSADGLTSRPPKKD